MNSEVLLTGPPGAARNKKEGKMRTKFAILLAIAAVCVTTALASWSPEALITGNSAGRSLYNNNGRKAVFGPDGVGHLIWDGGGVGCNRYDPLTGWASDYQISPTGSYPAIALDADGTTIHLVYGDATLCYRKCVRQGDGSDQWGPVVSLYGDHPTDYRSVASVPGDPGHVVVCWNESGQISRRVGYNAIGFTECVGGVWAAVRRLDSASAQRLSPSIAVAPNGDVFIAYHSGDDASGRKVYVKSRHNGVWGATVDVTPGLGSDQCIYPAIEVNPYTGNPHVVFNWFAVTQISKKVKDTTSAAYHTYRNSQGVWQTPRPISVPRHSGDISVLVHSPTMAFASDGRAYAAWCEYGWATSHGNKYSYYPGEGGAWSAPAWLTSDTTASYKEDWPHVAVDEHAQTVHAFWTRLYPGMGWETEIWWRNSSLGSGGGQAQPTALSQSRVELFPNPARAGRVTVQYSLSRAEPVRLTLLDVSGRAVRTQQVAAAGPNGAFSIDASGFNPGVYILKLQTGSDNLTRKLVIH
jgi:hypothetical protein